MAENGVTISRVSSSSSSSQQQSTTTTRPAITLSLPPRTSLENIFAGFSTNATAASGASPGPLSLVSSFFSDYSPGIGSRSFSQLLAGAMSSPAAIGSFGGVSSSIACNMIEDLGNNKEVKGDVEGGEKCDIVDLGFKQNRPMNLAVAHSPLFTIPPGLSPSVFLNSPGLFSPGLFSPGLDLFAMSHQQALAQVTAQAALSQSQMHTPSGYHPYSLTALAEPLKDNPSSTTNEIKDQHIPIVEYDPKNVNIESPEIPCSDNKPQASYQALDKPVDDGYHWRKYGQKQVKGGEYPRSYYKCSHHTCPVKKKVERSVEGQISEITYKGQHNHDLPPPSKRAKDGGETNVMSQSKSKGSRSAGAESLSMSNVANVSTFAQPAKMKEQTVSQATSAQLESSDHIEEIVAHETRKNTGNNNVEPNPKRRNIEVGVAKVAPSHKTVTEQRIIVQTRSEVDLLDDGFRWRKYGQKVVKGNPHPRSYYKCTTEGCNVRKHVERASTDVKAVITTYEGKHTHDPPTGRNNSNKMNTNQQQLKPHKVFTELHEPLAGMDFGSNHSNPVAILQLKKEQIQV